MKDGPRGRESVAPTETRSPTGADDTPPLIDKHQLVVAAVADVPDVPCDQHEYERQQCPEGDSPNRA